MRDELLRLSFLSKRHDEDWALRNASLSVYEGEIVKIVSDDALTQHMIARLLGGLEKPDSGKIILNGREIEIASPYEGRKLGIHVIYSESDLIPNLSVLDNLYLDYAEPG